MATTRQNISTGSAANDGTGDTLRSAGTKINANFGQIYNHLGGDSDNFSSQVSLADSSIDFHPTSGGNRIYLSSVPTLTGARNIQLPDAAGVVTLNTATQTLTNKNVTVLDLFAENTDFSNTGTITSTANSYIRVTNATGGNYNLTLNNGSAIGEIKFFTNTGADTVGIQPVSGSNFTLAASTGKKICIWDGSNWLQLT